MKTFAGLAVVGWAFLGLPPDTGARVVELKVDLAMNGSECVANFDESKKQVFKSKRDVLVWNVASTCPAPQAVRVCVSGGKPLRKCNGDPGHAKIGKEFTIEGGAAGTPAYATVSCHVKWDVLKDKPNNGKKKYLVEVLNGPAAHPRCIEKPVCPGPVCPEGSELALEVEP